MNCQANSRPAWRSRAISQTFPSANHGTKSLNQPRLTDTYQFEESEPDKNDPSVIEYQVDYYTVVESKTIDIEYTQDFEWIQDPYSEFVSEPETMKELKHSQALLLLLLDSNLCLNNQLVDLSENVKIALDLTIAHWNSNPQGSLKYFLVLSKLIKLNPCHANILYLL